MKQKPWVLVDTCIWSTYFKHSTSPTRTSINLLLRRDRAVLIGPVLTELLRGIKKQAEADWVSSVMLGTRFETLNWRDWLEAATLGRNLAARGHRDIPVTDLAIAATSLDRGWLVFSDDPHFDLVEGLLRFRLGDE